MDDYIYIYIYYVTLVYENIVFTTKKVMMRTSPTPILNTLEIRWWCQVDQLQGI